MWKLGLKIFGIAGLLVALITLFNWLRKTPENWNDAARGYLTHATRLEGDSVRWHWDSVGLRKVIALRDSSIAKKDTAIHILTTEARKAQDYADTYLTQYNSVVAKSDGDAALLSQQEAELALFRAYKANGTLRTDSPTLSPFSPLMTTAGLKTANREVIGRKVIDSLALSIGQVRETNKRLARNAERTSVVLGSQIADIEKKKKGGIPILRHKRVVQLTSVQDSLRKQKKELDDTMALERVLNEVRQ